MHFVIYFCSSISILHHIFFFFNDPATTEIYTLSLHDALPISSRDRSREATNGAKYCFHAAATVWVPWPRVSSLVGISTSDRKSTRLNSSHRCISYAVFCLKKKKTKQTSQRHSRKTTNEQQTLS